MINTIIGLKEYELSNASQLCLGTFDGFHMGHQKLASQSEFMITFDPHPKHIIETTTTIERLSFPNELAHFFPNILIIPFTKKVSNMSANDFLTEFIQPLRPTKLTVGYDFKFGKGGQGDFQSLEDWGMNNKCKIDKIELQVHNDSTPFKSSIIRKELKTNPNFAIELMGHPYLISGTVIEGDKRGHLIGFPTANLKVPENKCIPKYGVYKSSVIYNNKTFKSITYIGKKPTFKSDSTSIETHILEGFSDNIYGQPLKVFLAQQIRDDIRFSNQSELINQIKKDIQSLSL